MMKGISRVFENNEEKSSLLMKGSMEIFDGKVFLGFEKWTKKMSKNEKGK